MVTAKQTYSMLSHMTCTCPDIHLHDTYVPRKILYHGIPIVCNFYNKLWLEQTIMYYSSQTLMYICNHI